MFEETPPMRTRQEAQNSKLECLTRDINELSKRINKTTLQHNDSHLQELANAISDLHHAMVCFAWDETEFPRAENYEPWSMFYAYKRLMNRLQDEIGGFNAPAVCENVIKLKKRAENLKFKRPENISSWTDAVKTLKFSNAYKTACILAHCIKEDIRPKESGSYFETLGHHVTIDRKLSQVGIERLGSVGNKFTYFVENQSSFLEIAHDIHHLLKVREVLDS